MNLIILTEAEAEAARLANRPGPRTREALRILRDSERHLAADERRGAYPAPQNPPLVAGGQGRNAGEISRTSDRLMWLAVAVVILLAVLL